MANVMRTGYISLHYIFTFFVIATAQNKIIVHFQAHGLDVYYIT